MGKNQKYKQSTPKILTKGEIVRHSPYSLSIKQRRWKACLIGAISFVVVLGLSIQIETTLDRLESGMVSKRHAPSDRIQAINQQMESLHGKFSLLLAESVEMKLKALSRDMEQGKLDPEDARLFGELEKELALLEQYSVDMPPDQLKSEAIEHPRFKAQYQSQAQEILKPQDMSEQISRLRGFLYLGLSVISISLLAVLGTWIKDTRRLPHTNPLSTLPKELPKPKD